MECRIDFSLFNYRLNGSVNYYSRKQQDLLGVYDVALPPNGASQSFVNVGTMKNTGVEIELDWNAVKSKILIIQLVLWALLQIISLFHSQISFMKVLSIIG